MEIHKTAYIRNKLPDDFELEKLVPPPQSSAEITTDFRSTLNNMREDEDTEESQNNRSKLKRGDL